MLSIKPFFTDALMYENAVSFSVVIKCDICIHNEIIFRFALQGNVLISISMTILIHIYFIRKSVISIMSEDFADQS